MAAHTECSFYGKNLIKQWATIGKKMCGAAHCSDLLLRNYRVLLGS